MSMKTLTAAITRAGSPPLNVDLVVVGVSTGGPVALSTLVAGMPESFPCPILIVQHVQTGMSRSLVQQLAQKTKLRIMEAEHGAVPKAGELHLAPGGKHMTVVRNAIAARGGLFEIRLNEDEQVNSCRPSVDVFFKSVAECSHKNIVAVIMTGMGQDGAAGMEELVNRAHAYVLSQDKASSIVWGMPEAVVQRGLAHEIVPLELLAHRLCQLAKCAR